MNSKVDFAAGGIVLINKKILLVKNRLRKEYEKNYSSGFWGFPKGHLEEEKLPLKQQKERFLKKPVLKLNV